MVGTRRPRVFVYVDGFNLYYGSLRRTPYRWLDVGALVSRLLPATDICKIWYFTAEPKPDPADPGKILRHRHREYMRALGTIGHLEIKSGFYQLKPSDQRKVYPLYAPDPKLPNAANRVVTVWKAEEKGSDVNLATALLIDAAARRFDEAWVVSNDADLAWPVERAQAEYGVWVGVYKPERPVSFPSHTYRQDSWHLKSAAGAFRRPREPQLAGCQFPDTLANADGPIVKPTRWNGP